MNAKLIWNANASNTTNDPNSIIEALKNVGIIPELCQTECLEDLDLVLEQNEDAVIVAGGDGSLRQVVKRLRGRDIPIILLPLGTANNFAGALGVRRDPFELIAALEHRTTRQVDLGVVRFNEQEDVFLEGAGVGLFAHAMLSYGEDHGKSVLRALHAITKTITLAPKIQMGFRATLEDNSIETFSGNLSLFEVMNTTALGPRLPLVPSADLSDGLLDLLTIEPDGSTGFLNYAINALSGSLESLENVTLRRIKEVQLDFSGGALHFDGDSCQLPISHVEFWIEPNAITMIVPQDMTQAVPQETENPDAN